MNYCIYCGNRFYDLEKHLWSEEHRKNISVEGSRQTKIRIISRSMEDIHDFYKNADKYLSEIPREKGNEGNNQCPVCGIRVGSLYRHRFSILHRHNVLKAGEPFILPVLDDFKVHFDKCSKSGREAILKNNDNPYWMTAEELLDRESYKLLKEYMHGR